MKLTREQSEKLLRERGVWITDACDKCGQLLGAVRWTRKGERGEWCSGACRDGVSAAVPNLKAKLCLECGVSLDGKRTDSEFCDPTHRMRFRRKTRMGQNREISANMPIGKQRLSGAEIQPLPHNHQNENRALKTPRNRNPDSAQEAHRV
jgi:hypothetical protein